MKHLKRFNESVDSFDNKEISTEEFNKLKFNALSVTDREFNIITSIFAGDDYSNLNRKSFSFTRSSISNYNEKIPKISPYIKVEYKGVSIGDVYKLSDDWFILHNTKIYKCDTLLGLKELVGNRNIKSVKESIGYDNVELSDKIYKRYRKNSIRFQDDEFEYIKKECEILNITASREDFIDLSDNSKIDCIKLKSKYSLYRLRIFKLEDDWFLLSKNSKSYKCDTIDGLIEVIKREKNNM